MKNPSFDADKYKLHPEDHRGKEKINSLLGDAGQELQTAKEAYLGIVQKYEALSGEVDEALQEAENAAADSLAKIQVLRKYKALYPVFSQLARVEPQQEAVVLPVTAAALVSKEEAQGGVSVQVNGKRYSLTPLNSDRGGKRALGRFGDLQESDDTEILDSAIYSLKVEDTEELYILLGEVVADV